jgi:hypothetical protein
MACLRTEARPAVTTDEKFLAEHTPHRHKRVNAYGWVIVATWVLLFAAAIVAVVTLYWGYSS